MTDLRGKLKASDRYPFTYACDWVRMISEDQMSRSDASQIISERADQLGLNQRVFACQLADEFVEREVARATADELEAAAKRAHVEWVQAASVSVSPK